MLQHGGILSNEPERGRGGGYTELQWKREFSLDKRTQLKKTQSNNKPNSVTQQVLFKAC